jgi:HECT-like Ubiquitin-conjugating enzyme (E2)-binding
VDRSTGGWRIMKRDVHFMLDTYADTTDEPKVICSTIDTWSLVKWLAADLLQSIENDGVRRFLLTPVGPTAKKKDTLLVR